MFVYMQTITRSKLCVRPITYIIKNARYSYSLYHLITIINSSLRRPDLSTNNTTYITYSFVCYKL